MLKLVYPFNVRNLIMSTICVILNDTKNVYEVTLKDGTKYTVFNKTFYTRKNDDEKGRRKYSTLALSPTLLDELCDQITYIHDEEERIVWSDVDDMVQMCDFIDPDLSVTHQQMLEILSIIY